MSKKLKRELIEWGLFVTFIGVIYIGGWTTEVAGTLQRLVLSTGVIQSSELAETKKADYHFQLTDASDENIPFSTFENKVVFLNFWATWCPPCIAEMPDIQNLYEKRDDIEFVMIALDKDFQQSKDFIARKGFEFPIYKPNSSVPSVFSTSAIPTTYLIDKEGNVVVANAGMAKYNTKKFNALLDELVAQ